MAGQTNWVRHQQWVSPVSVVVLRAVRQRRPDMKCVIGEMRRHQVISRSPDSGWSGQMPIAPLGALDQLPVRVCPRDVSSSTSISGEPGQQGTPPSRFRRPVRAFPRSSQTDRYSSGSYGTNHSNATGIRWSSCGSKGMILNQPDSGSTSPSLPNWIPAQIPIMHWPLLRRA